MISLKRLLREYREYPSKLDASVKVIITRKGDGFYAKLKHHFSKCGDAVLDAGNRKIYIDGEVADKENWSVDHFLFVEAHEIAHLRLKHDTDNSDETEADFYAICHLLDKGYEEAARIGVSQFKYRNGLTFEEYKDRIDANK